jgi:DNA-binding IclR family transcriptional regulator
MAVTRVLRLLRILADHPAGLALTPLCMVMNAPKTSVLSLLRGLTVHGYLQRSNGAYGLGPESFALGASLVSARSLDVVALPFLREAAERSGETALIARIDRAADRLVYNPIIESTRAIRYAVPVGTTRPLFASSAGRVLLAFQDEAWRRDYLRRADLRAMTEHSVTDPAQLARLIEAARVSGLAVTFGEVTLDVAGFSAPIFEPDGRVNAALIIAAPIERGRAAADALPHLVMELAASISGALGHRAVPQSPEVARNPTIPIPPTRRSRQQTQLEKETPP